MIGAVTHVNTDAPLVALTFDDGPHPEYTPRLLDLLDHYDAKATFFVIGQAAQQHRNILARMARTGHCIGNHTWDHPSFPTIGRGARRAQIRAWAKAVAPYGQKFFRPPYGNLTRSAALELRLLGYQVITWNLVGHDWLPEPADSLYARIADQLKPGSIVLLHDALYHAVDPSAFDRTPTLLAVESVLQQFSPRFQFVTVPELMRHGRVQLSNWERPPNLEWLSTLQPSTVQPQPQTRLHP